MNNANSWTQFENWEGMEQDRISVRRAYVEMLNGDVTAAYLLSQIVYWHLPDRRGNTKLRVWKSHPDTGERMLWMAKSAREWKDEIGLTPDRTRRAMDVLRKAGVIESYTWRFDGSNTTHVRLLKDEFVRLLWKTHSRLKAQKAAKGTNGVSKQDELTSWDHSGESPN